MDQGEWRYFVTYSGIKLPLKLISPLGEDELGHRNTYFRARFDAEERIVACEKLVYGDVQLSHRYEYHPGGGLKRALIEMDGEENVLEFDPA